MGQPVVGTTLRHRLAPIPRQAARRVLRAVRALERRVIDPLEVFVYHSIGDPVCDPWHLSVTQRHFGEQVEQMSVLGQVVDLDVELHQGPWRRPRRSGRRFAITFDDGYVDNLRVATKELERFDAHATVFIATHFVDEPYFWWDRLAELVVGRADDQKYATARIETLVDCAGRVGVLPPQGVEPLAGASLMAVHAEFYDRLVVQAPGQIRELLDQITADVGFVSEGASRPVTTDELIELAQHPLITIGAHTMSHRRLVNLPREVVSSELREGDRHLDEWLGPGDRLLAYPYGLADRTTAHVASRAGFEFGFTTVSRPISMTDRRMMLPRLDTSDVGGDAFRRALQRRGR